MISFWTTYWNKNRDILLDGDFRPQGFTENYNLISASNDKKIISAVYGERIISLEKPFSKIDLINGKLTEDVYLNLDFDMGNVSVKILDCSGKLISEKPMELQKGVVKFKVPASGLLQISLKK